MSAGSKADKVKSFQGGDLRWARYAQLPRRRRFTVHQAKVLTRTAARRASRAAEREDEDE